MSCVSRREVFSRSCSAALLLLLSGCESAFAAGTAGDAGAGSGCAGSLSSSSVTTKQEDTEDDDDATRSSDPLLSSMPQMQTIDVYFGCGCFWHVQHEMVEAERTLLLRRNDLDLTSRTAYAGGVDRGNNEEEEEEEKEEQVVCYHNYAALGHAEVVSMAIPRSSFYQFALVYCNLFRNGMRPDQFGDRGRQYRNVVGIPGGVEHSQFLVQQLLDASRQAGDQLDFAEGGGTMMMKKRPTTKTTKEGYHNDDDDIARLVWIMDSTKFPPFKAEAYHQFHDGFYYGENYGREYNAITNRLINERGEQFLF